MRQAMALSMITLPRLELPTVNFQAVINIAKFASDKLGYEGAAEEIRNIKLLAVLSSINLMPFVPNAVAEYKKQQQKKARSGVWNLRVRMDTHWRLANLTRYEGIVPFSVLDTAKQVLEAANKEAVNVNFSVDYLADHTMEKEDPRVYDPFLCVNVSGGPRHRIAVWDEPTFKY